MSGTSVPSPTLGATGFIAPTEAAVLAGVQSDLNAAFGGNLNSSLTTPQGQLASSETAIIGDANAAFTYFTNQVDPAYASGRMQDAIGRIYFITRIAAQATVVSVLCTGLSNVVIPAGTALLQAQDGNTYICNTTTTIPASGNVVITFSCSVTGPIACPPQTFTIYTTIPGWDSAVASVAGQIGSLVESRTAFETRRGLTVAQNANGTIPAILGAVLNVPGVLDAYVTDNSTSSSATVGGVTLGANSVYCCVYGGASAAVAYALWTKKQPGCAYSGNTSVTVRDPNPIYGGSGPTYNVTFATASAVPIYIAVTITNSSSVPSTALTQIQAAVISAFTGADGGTRARIGNTLYASRYYGGIATLGAWAQIVDIYIGQASGPTSNTTTLNISQEPTINAANITLTLM